MNDIGRCGTCKHWERIEYEREDGAIVVAIADGFDTGWCHAREPVIRIAAGSITYEQPVTLANYPCTDYAAACPADQ